MEEEKVVLNEELLPRWMPESVKQYLAFKLDDFRDIPSLKRSKNWEKPTNAEELKQAYEKAWPVFVENSLKKLWLKLDEEGLAKRFCFVIINNIPTKFSASRNIKEIRNDIREGIDKLEYAIRNLKSAKHLAFHVTSSEYESIGDNILKLEELLEVTKKSLNGDWVNNNIVTGKNIEFWPKSREANESVFYQNCLYEWFSENLGTPHERYIAEIVRAIFPDAKVDTTNISSNTKDLRKALKQ